MAWAIRLVGVPDGGYSARIISPWEGFWLKSYDADANAGLGQAEFTAEAAEALRFDTYEDAKECWYARSNVLPTREVVPGRPFENRPLAVCDIAIDAVD